MTRAGAPRGGPGEGDRLTAAVGPAEWSAPLHGRAALVTGGSRGIGRAIALKLARDGADVAVGYLRRRSAAEAVAEAVRALGRRAAVVRGDVSDDVAVARIVRESVDALGGLNIVVANAAFGVMRPALDLDAKGWHRTLDAMGRSLLTLAQAAVAHLEGRPGARIIGISSPGWARVMPNYAAVGSAKAVLETLTRYLAVELAPRGILVNAVSGGVIETDALEQFPNRDELLAAAAARTPLGRAGRPEDIADVVALLCREEARWICGQVIVADGGYTIVM